MYCFEIIIEIAETKLRDEEWKKGVSNKSRYTKTYFIIL